MIYKAIVFLPALGALIAGLFGRVLGARPCEIITTSFVGRRPSCRGSPSGRWASAARRMRIPVLRWVTSGELDVSWALRIDTLTAVMLVVVNTVSALVHLYSIGYMHEDDSRPRFFAYLSHVHLRHAGAGDERQLPAAVLRLGGRRPRLLPADRLLVPEARGQRGGHQGLHRQPRRRLRLRARHLRHLRRVRHHRLRRRVPRRARHGRQAHGVPRPPVGHADRAVPAAVHGRHGQVGAVPAAHLAARRHGGPDARSRR